MLYCDSIQDDVGIMSMCCGCALQSPAAYVAAFHAHNVLTLAGLCLQTEPLMVVHDFHREFWLVQIALSIRLLQWHNLHGT
jgi:hypothetical protein